MQRKRSGALLLLLLVLRLVACVLELQQKKTASSAQWIRSHIELEHKLCQPVGVSGSGAHHDDEDPDKDGDEVGEEGERVLDVVHVATVRPLDDLLCVVHHVPEEDQQAKVNLQST